VSGRSEDDLRAAFAAKATEAPAASDVARAVNQAVTRGPKRRPGWLVPVVTAAAAVAIGVPLAIALSSGGSDSNKRGAAARSPLESVQSSTGAGAGRSAGVVPPGEARPSPQAPADGKATQAACRPTDVTVTVRRNATGATLSVTSRGSACRLARMPTVQWPGTGTTYSAGSSAAQPAPNPPTGQLAPGATATASVRPSAPCQLTGDVVNVDFGAGSVEVHAEGPSAGSSCTPVGVGSLQVSEFTGLS
jgi:hypothetical protein